MIIISLHFEFLIFILSGYLIFSWIYIYKRGCGWWGDSIKGLFGVPKKKHRKTQLTYSFTSLFNGIERQNNNNNIEFEKLVVKPELLFNPTSSWPQSDGCSPTKRAEPTFQS